MARSSLLVAYRDAVTDPSVADPDLDRLPVTPADVLAAAQRIDGAVVRTPCTRSLTLSAITGAEVWVKFEQLQFTASFKERGAVNRLLQLDADERRRGVVAVSAGNHAQAVAHHATRLGIPSTIVMPAFTPVTKVTGTRVLGAEVVLEGETFEAAAAHAARLAVDRRLVTVHPYDDPFIVAGQGTVGLEIAADVPDLDTVIVPIGGGGLISGIALAIKHLLPGVRVIGVEARGYDWASRLKGHGATEANGPSVAEGIAVKSGSELTRTLVGALVDEVVTVSEAAIEQAVGAYLEIEKVVAEGAGAAPLAALMEHRQMFAGRRCALVLCGGNIDLRLLSNIAVRTLARSGRLARLTLELDDRPGSLARFVDIIAATGANIVEVQHTRNRLAIAAKRVDIEVEIETSGPDALQRTIDQLHAAGLAPRLDV